MRKILLFLSFILVIPLFAQDFKSHIETQFNDYNKLIAEKQFEKALTNYGNEHYLKVVPIDQLVSLMNEMFNSTEIDFILEKPHNVVVSDEIIEQNGEKFVKIDYQQNFEMKFNNPDLARYTIYSSLKNDFGSENVEFDKETGYFLITTNKVAVGNSNDLQSWKFSILEKKSIPVLIKFIPEQYLKNLK